ncbi:hypothetical protein K4L44_16195 [Halosquirtibacter laminarini]|uniref:Uncharacterized protein n=1 Tax=Halosquirtibacter laminarini TaxID=3374600 RepID=A0AC61NEV2_9BACT|nr:hypothetical protein K4L44_16195 [Prolixibacteraceae bacterium]
MIDQSTIDKVIDTAKIEEVVGEEVDLRKRGVNLLGLCPFHNEKTPSFTVSPAKGIFKCFGCGEAGDSIGFVMKFQRINFFDAIRVLAKRYHIEYEEEEESPEAALRRKEREARQVILTWTQGYYNSLLKNLKTSNNHPGFIPFLQKWNITEDMIENYHIGLSISKGDNLYKTLTSKGFKKEIIVSTSLVSEGENEMDDFFRNELIFPIHSIAGRVSGFCSINLNNMDSQEGFKILSDNPSFQSEKEILGLFQAKGDSLKKKCCHIISHPLEMLYLFSNQQQNSVFIPQGTLSNKQIKQITRFTNSITLWSDKSMSSVLECYNRISILIHEGVNVKIVDTQSENLTHYLKDQRTSIIEDHITNSKDWLHFLVETLYPIKESLGMDNTAIFNKIIQIVSIIPDAIVKGVYVTEFSRLVNLPEELIWSELKNIGK